MAWPRIVAMPALLPYPDSLHWHCESCRGSAHYTGGFMETLPTKAITKGELNSRNDKAAAVHYSKRREIDLRNERRALQRQIGEVWDDPLHFA
ncbi:PA3496 family putative envelope integrity protein [Vreelandella aquamarina]|uniref:PA3496 family putative envelope integrity protein n=1 Tax=Vreelandella aquamarina TaxID=77097 RepID=UPI00384FFC21